MAVGDKSKAQQKAVGDKSKLFHVKHCYPIHSETLKINLTFHSLTESSIGGMLLLYGKYV